MCAAAGPAFPQQKALRPRIGTEGVKYAVPPLVRASLAGDASACAVTHAALYRARPSRPTDRGAAFRQAAPEGISIDRPVSLHQPDTLCADAFDVLRSIKALTLLHCNRFSTGCQGHSKPKQIA